MTRRPRRNHTLAAKAKVALAAIKGDGGSTAYRRDPACDLAEWSDQPAGVVRFASLLINLPSLADALGAYGFRHQVPQCPGQCFRYPFLAPPSSEWKITRSSTSAAVTGRRPKASCTAIRNVSRP